MVNLQQHRQHKDWDFDDTTSVDFVMYGDTPDSIFSRKTEVPVSLAANVLGDFAEYH